MHVTHRKRFVSRDLVALAARRPQELAALSEAHYHDQIESIADEVLAVLEQTSPELVSDISETGITLTGGCSQVWGFTELLIERTGIPCILADDPDSCTAYGCGKSLAWINHMQEGPINIARRRMMRQKF